MATGNMWLGLEKLKFSHTWFLARDVIYTYRAYAKMSVSVRLSVCLSVTEVHAAKRRGHLNNNILCYASHC